MQGIINHEFKTMFDGFPERKNDVGYPPNFFRKGQVPTDEDKDDYKSRSWEDESPNTVYVPPPRGFPISPNSR